MGGLGFKYFYFVLAGRNLTKPGPVLTSPSLLFLSDSVEVHDSRWGPSDEEPSLQADPGLEHSLRGPSANPAHWDSFAEQTAWTMGSSQFPSSNHFQELQHLWTVVQCSVCHDWRKGTVTVFWVFFERSEINHFNENEKELTEGLVFEIALVVRDLT